MADHEAKQLSELILTLEKMLLVLSITLVEKRVLTRADIIENLDDVALGTAHRPDAKISHDMIERMISRIRDFPLAD